MMHDQHERASPVAVAHRGEVRHAFIVGAVICPTSLVQRRCWLVVSRSLDIITVSVHRAHAVRCRSQSSFVV